MNIIKYAKEDLYPNLNTIKRHIDDIIMLYADYKYNKHDVRKRGLTKQDYVREINSHIRHVTTALNDIKRKL